MNALVIGRCLATLASEPNNETPRNDTVSTSLTTKWTGPYHGVPPFDVVKVADLKPALEAGMNAPLAAIEAITSRSEGVSCR